MPPDASVPGPLSVSVHVMQHIGAEGRGMAEDSAVPGPLGAIGNPPTIEPSLCAPPCLIPTAHW